MELTHKYSWTAGPRILGAALAGAGLLTLCFGPRTAGAATDAIEDTDHIVAELRGLEVRAESLSLDIADPAAADDGDDLDIPLDTDPVAPVLRLTPRVATILREVFGPDLLAAPEQDTAAVDTSQTGDSPRTVSPLASESGPDPDTVAPDLGEARSNFYVPRFQRQMYRTDI